MSRLDSMKRALGQVLLWHPATGGMTVMESRELTIDLAQSALNFSDRETDLQEAAAGRPSPLSDPAAQAVKPHPSPERESLASAHGQGTQPGTIPSAEELVDPDEAAHLAKEYPASLSDASEFAPAMPKDGDTWNTTAGVYARINGITVFRAHPPHYNNPIPDFLRRAP